MSAIQIEDTLRYINLARTEPVKFAEFVKDDINSFISDTQMPLYGNCYYRVNESKQTWIECYKFLIDQKPLPPLRLSQALTQAAQDHAIDLAKTGMMGHTGSDGSSMADRIARRGQGQWTGSMAENVGSDFFVQGRNHALKTVMGLIIDDGVPSRGHRRNIFSTDTQYIGIYSAIQGDKILTVMDFLTHDLAPKKKGSLETQKFEAPQYPKKQVPIHNFGMNKKPQNFASFDKFQNMMSDGGMQHMAKMHDKSEKYAVSTSKSTSTSIINGKKTVKTIEKIKYSDGTIEENQTTETF